MFIHSVCWRSGVTTGTMPAPVAVTPIMTLSENVVKTAAGTRHRKRHGIWLGVKIKWTLEPSELASLNSMLAAENSDTTAFELSLNGGTTYRNAALSNDPDASSYQGVNVAVDVTLEFEFTTRLTAFPSPVHLGT
jgi:hypothetical protein